MADDASLVLAANAEAPSSRMLRELTDEQLSDIGQRRSSNENVSPRPTDRLDER